MEKGRERGPSKIQKMKDPSLHVLLSLVEKRDGSITGVCVKPTFDIGNRRHKDTTVGHAGLVYR